jgi:putative transcriptional regulator
MTGRKQASEADALIEGMTNAVKYLRGEPVGARVHKVAVEVPDVAALRRRLRLSQSAFAAAYRIPLSTLKNWEQGRRLPDAPASAYLRAIANRPKEVREAVAG